jgi:lipoate-protein ligase A
MHFMRFIDQGENPAAFNMALDEAISVAVRQKHSPPTIRLYQWDIPSVTIGFFQRTSDINTVYCAEKGYPVIRRITGGRAILHDAELTYSVSSLKDSFPFGNRLFEDYSIISKALAHGLASLGVDAHLSFSKKRAEGHRYPACFKAVSYGEVTVGGRKIIGSAQKRYHDGFLQQGSIMLDFRPEELSNVLNGCTEEDCREIGAVNSSSGKLLMRDLKLSLKEAFEKELRVKTITDGPSTFELSLAKELEIKKYAAREWNFAR